MRFAHSFWLFGSAFALVVAGLLIAGGFVLVRSIRTFGAEQTIADLVTGRAAARRALKGVLLVLAVAAGFLALAKPQYGRGTRLIPATNLDVVVVLDYSKSMYARDVAPSRIERAKAEVGRLIADLPGARFGAVAFAGQPMSFPLTSDGSAIAQFFRQLSPEEMPIGGTAIARALQAGRELFDRDPLSAKHRRVLLLVTDGEDLEGDPVGVAKAAATDGVTIYVAQVGGRSPEPIPEMNEAGEVVGWRKDLDGSPLTTALSAEGEKQLAEIAQAAAGSVIRSERGSTGLREVASRLSRLMTDELSEQVETVYADVYVYPLGLAVLLLCIETFIPETRRRKHASVVPKAPKARRQRRARPRAAEALLLLLLGSSCERNLNEPFMRHAPPVDEAIGALDAGEASAAKDLLSEYLATGECKAGVIGTPPRVRDKSNASFDLALALFEVAERFGRRFGEEESAPDAAPTPEEELSSARRSSEIDCALRLVTIVAGDSHEPIELQARAHYLAGNLDFLRREYESAVKGYDRALELVPGLAGDAGDSVGRDAAWNRAIALRRIEEKKQEDAGPDAPPEAGPDAPPEAGPDAPPDGDDAGDARDEQEDSGSDSGDAGRDSGDSSEDAGGGRDAGEDGSPNDPSGGDAGKDADGQDASAPKDSESPKREPPPSHNQDENILDMLEQAPTLQQEQAKKSRGAVRGMEDK